MESATILLARFNIFVFPDARIKPCPRRGLTAKGKLGRKEGEGVRTMEKQHPE